MIILAIEQSTPTASLALCRDGDRLAETSWTDTRFHSQQLFAFLPRLLSTAAISLDQVDVFAVGLGPGSFSGLRIALAAAQAFALPSGRAVYGISSSDSIAEEVSQTVDVADIVIVGDARRERLWMGHFARHDDGTVAQQGSFRLIRPEQLSTLIPAGAALATPHWETLSATLKRICPGRAHLVPGAAVPTARRLADIAARRIERHLPSEPLAPIYLHPPVAIAPRYPPVSAV